MAMTGRKKMVVTVAAAGVAAFVAGWGLRTVRDRMPAPDRSAAMVGSPQTTPDGPARGISIGGDFALTDHRGRPVTLADFKGDFLLVFFGYTFCPDVCPTELQRISEVLRRLGKPADRVQPLFITIDPARDTAKVLADYVANFHPRLIGLTGTVAQIKAAAKAYGVYFSKTWATETGKPPPGMSPAEADKEYFMSHTSFVYLIGPDGRMRDIFRPGVKSVNMSKRIRAAVAAQPGAGGT